MNRSFVISRFKSIESLKLELRSFMALVGPNGAGKTNIVRALELFGQILQRGSTDPIREEGWDYVIRRSRPRAQPRLTFGATLPLSSALFHDPPDDECEDAYAGLTLDMKVVLEGGKDDAVDVAEEALVLRNARGTLRLTARAGRVTIRGDGELAILANALSPLAASVRRDGQAGLEEFARGLSVPAERVPQSARSQLRFVNGSHLVAFWAEYVAASCRTTRVRLDVSALRADTTSADLSRGALGPGGQGLAVAVDRFAPRDSPAYRRVLESLQTVYPRIQWFGARSLGAGRMTLRFKEQGVESEFGPESISDGTLHALALLLLVEDASHERGVLAVEEPENALHPWSLRAILERAQQRGALAPPLLMTTHSTTVVDAVRDPDDLFVVEYDDEEGTTVAPARDRESAIDAILSETGQKLGGMWDGGSFGGVPRSPL